MTCGLKVPGAVQGQGRIPWDQEAARVLRHIRDMQAEPQELKEQDQGAEEQERQQHEEQRRQQQEEPRGRQRLAAAAQTADGASDDEACRVTPCNKIS